MFSHKKFSLKSWFFIYENTLKVKLKEYIFFARMQLEDLSGNILILNSFKTEQSLFSLFDFDYFN